MIEFTNWRHVRAFMLQTDNAWHDKQTVWKEGKRKEEWGNKERVKQLGRKEETEEERAALP